MHNLQHDIDKYLRGEMTSAEMHALERKALHDPFVRDALEGAQLVGPDDFATDMLELQKRFEKTSDKKVVSLWTWPLRIAAGLIFLAVASILIINLIPDKPADNLALNKTTSPQESPKADTAQTETPAVSGQAEAEIQAEEKIQKRDQPDVPGTGAPVPAASSSPAVEDDRTELRASEPELADITPSTESAPVLADTTTTRQPFPVATAPAASEAARAKTIRAQDIKEETAKKVVSPDAMSGYIATSKVVKGQVTDVTDGTGLPGVNVMIKGTNVGTVTDIHGNYQLTTPATTNELVFSYIGYQSQEVDVAAAPADVKLEQDVSQLSEVVVVGYGEASTDESEKETIEFAVPKGGRTAFKKYLEKNLVYPQLALENNVEGKVTVQFTIGATGRMDNFTILKGIGYGCDEEVIRLIKAGPRWTPTKRDGESTPDKVKVRMRFRLPRKK